MTDIQNLLHKRFAIDESRMIHLDFKNDAQVYAVICYDSIRAFYIKRSNFLEKIKYKLSSKYSIKWFMKNFSVLELKEFTYKIFEIEGKDIEKIKALEKEEVKKKISLISSHLKKQKTS